MKPQIQKKKEKRKKKNCGITKTTIFPIKKFLMGRQTLFWGKNYGKVVLNWKTNDQIMPRNVTSFVNDKCIFQ